MLEVHLSPSQMLIFDTNQYGGCHRKWWLSRCSTIEREDSVATLRGKQVHQELENYMRGMDGQWLGALARKALPFLPERGDDLKIETEFDDLVFDATRYKGRIDLAHARGTFIGVDRQVHQETEPTAEVIDYKTKGSSYGMHSGVDLRESVQMLTYGVWACTVWPAVTQVRLSHILIPVDGSAEKRTAVVSVSELRRRWEAYCKPLANEIKRVALIEDYLDVVPNPDSCGAWPGGCPYRVLCDDVS